MSIPAITMNYDPNLNLCGRMTLQTVEMTFGMWDYRVTYARKVGGNCTGLAVIDSAVEGLYEELLGEREFAQIRMTNRDDQLTVTDEEDQRDEWLKDMLICAEIVAIEAAP